MTQTAGAGTVILDAGTGPINLSVFSNDFTGVVNLTGGATLITNGVGDPLTLGTIATGDLTATTNNGSLNLGTGTVAGNLMAATGGSAVSQSGPLTVTGNSSVIAGTTGTVTLADAGNGFGPCSGIVGCRHHGSGRHRPAECGQPEQWP